MRFTGPKHTTEVYAPSGPIAVKDGVADLRDDAPACDADAMRRAGFSPDPQPQPEPAAKPVAAAKEA